MAFGEKSLGYHEVSLDRGATRYVFTGKLLSRVTYTHPLVSTQKVYKLYEVEGGYRVLSTYEEEVSGKLSQAGIKANYPELARRAGFVDIIDLDT